MISIKAANQCEGSMNRKALIISLILACLVSLLLVGLIAIQVAQRQESDQQGITAEDVQRKAFQTGDPFANRELDAIELVQKYKVLSPEYIAAYDEAQKSGKAPSVDPSYVTIESLVENDFLEKRFNMEFLKRGTWRALHLDTDTGEMQIPDPQYEVYLDYQDEAVTVGPVWIVDLETGIVVARNDMASVFEQTIYNYQKVAENLKRPASVVRAIISHKFDVGIDLGGVFLLHFLKLANASGHENDRIIGWTVMHEFQDDFSAYFQWVEREETRVAKFRFNWKSKSLEPRGLLAIDLMAAGDNMQSIKPVDIYPKEYTNDLHIPRTERWIKGHSCRSRDYQMLCTAFVKVLEQQEFVNAMAWLLTNGEADANRRIDQCKEDKKCRWRPRQAADEFNPNNRADLIEISYEYELNGRPHSVHFLVDSAKEIVTPLDKLSQWAYWSVTPRT